MASRQAEFFVSVQDNSDPKEVRPNDDQAIVFDADKFTPTIDYLNELNKYVDDEDSFEYHSRISGDRICVVFTSAEIATKLIEEVGFFEVNGKKIAIKNYVAKAV